MQSIRTVPMQRTYSWEVILNLLYFLSPLLCPLIGAIIGAGAAGLFASCIIFAMWLEEYREFLVAMMVVWGAFGAGAGLLTHLLLKGK